MCSASVNIENEMMLCSGNVFWHVFCQCVRERMCSASVNIENEMTWRVV